MPSHDSRGIPESDALSAVAGRWMRGETSVSAIRWSRSASQELVIGVVTPPSEAHRNRVRLIACDPSETYVLADVGRSAARALRKLSTSRSEEGIVAFIRQFGPLLDFGRWIEDGKIASSPPGKPSGLSIFLSAIRHRDEQKRRDNALTNPTVIGGMDDDEDFDDIVSEVATGIQKSIASKVRSLNVSLTRGMESGETFAIQGAAWLGGEFPSDVLSYLSWCFRNQRVEDALYVLSLSEEFRRIGQAALTSPYQVPLSLYIWASEYVERVDRDLRRGADLSPELQWWMQARLNETRLAVGKKSETLVMRATTLLSYLAAQTILDVRGATPEQRTCRACGKVFPVLHGHQRYCSEQHANQYRQRKYQQRSHG